MNTKSIVIINSNSELDSLLFLMDNKPGLINENILIIDRRQDQLAKSNIFINRNLNYLNLNCSHNWTGFVISAQKAAYQILSKYKIENVYIFSKYDPLITLINKKENSIKIILISQHPQHPSLTSKEYSKSGKKRLKAFIKSILFFILTGQKNRITYIGKMHNMETQDKLFGIIRLYPYHKENTFNFGKIYTNMPDNQKLIYVGADYSSLPKVDYNEFLQDTINLIKNYSIREFCFHPRDSSKFKIDIKSALPEINFHSSYVSFKEMVPINNYLVVSIASTVGFDLLINGLSVVFIPDLFPSLKSNNFIKSFKSYIDSVGYKYT